MDMTLAELQEMAARQQQQIEAQQQLLASKVCESTRWKVGAGRLQKSVESQDTRAALMEIKAKARGGGGSKYWGNNKVDVVMRMWGDTLLRGIWTKAWKRMECTCRLWLTGDVFSFLAGLIGSLLLFVHHFRCLLAVNRQQRLLCFQFFWVNCILMHW